MHFKDNLNYYYPNSELVCLITTNYIEYSFRNGTSLSDARTENIYYSLFNETLLFLIRSTVYDFIKFTRTN